MKTTLRNRFLSFIAPRLFDVRRITAECEDKSQSPYIDRYFVLGSTYSRWGIYLHHIWRSDLDRALHDHPWNFISLIIDGGYTEITGNDRTYYGPGSILFRPAQWRHALQLDYPVWTLVLRTKKRRSWGFYDAKLGWVHWRQYDAARDC